MAEILCEIMPHGPEDDKIWSPSQLVLQQITGFYALRGMSPLRYAIANLEMAFNDPYIVRCPHIFERSPLTLYQSQSV